MSVKISDPKVYEYIVFQHDPNKDLMLKALDMVRDFITEKKLTITGGMAVDFALKLKGSKLYDDNTLPDYDFFSPEHSNDAYELAKLLCYVYLNFSLVKNFILMQFQQPTLLRCVYELTILRLPILHICHMMCLIICQHLNIRSKDQTNC